jgi:Rrf2 family protein
MSANCRFAMAVHVLAVLAYKQGDRVSSELLASSVNTNPVIIRRLLSALQQAKLVETRRGPGSGSRLSCSPARINLAQIYHAVECEEPFILPRKKANSECPVGRMIAAAMEQVCASTRAALERELAKTTLASVVEGIGGRAGRFG